jgi:hypothetical protein
LVYRRVREGVKDDQHDIEMLVEVLEFDPGTFIGSQRNEVGNRAHFRRSPTHKIPCAFKH